jgi:hypothetical protein
MNGLTAQKGFVDTAMTFAFSPIIAAFLVGALPVLLPMLAVRGMSRLFASGRRVGQA